MALASALRASFPYAVPRASLNCAAGLPSQLVRASLLVGDSESSVAVRRGEASTHFVGFSAVASYVCQREHSLPREPSHDFHIVLDTGLEVMSEQTKLPPKSPELAPSAREPPGDFDPKSVGRHSGRVETRG